MIWSKVDLIIHWKLVKFNQTTIWWYKWVCLKTSWIVAIWYIILEWNILTLMIPLASSPIWNNIETENKRERINKNKNKSCCVWCNLVNWLNWKKEWKHSFAKETCGCLCGFNICAKINKKEICNGKGVRSFRNFYLSMCKHCRKYL